ncbi:MAG: bacillithiol biosynthesis cysteine-adding enzyme BshC [Saprospirales bacterium]|nr:bacillithiol biosynthesis cysteine-adding enzyme BshC [Saprospirales bacterium]
MTRNDIPFDQVPQFSGRDKAYTLGNPALTPFYAYPLTLEGFGQVIGEKSTVQAPRTLLVRVLEEQYAGLERTPQIDQHIKALLQPSAFTVVTAHQPVLFTGPLYFIYKIVSTINLAKKLGETYPDVQVVPVMIIGGEDHDFEEVNHAHLFGRTLTWEANAGGSVGQLHTESMSAVLEELRGLLGESDYARELSDILEQSFAAHDRYGSAMQYFVNSLFKDQGLLVLHMDHPDLKREFSPHMRRELLEQPSRALVEESQAELEKLGFPSQAYARPINLFYLSEGSRERIEETDGIFQVVNTTLRFSREEIIAELDAHPERFSPNVILRPLYQESILPNLAYVGGGGELAYWLERRKQFDHFGIKYPILVRRNSVLWIDSNSQKRMEKLGVSLRELMGDTEELVKDWIHQRSEQELSLEQERSTLHLMFEDIAQRTQTIDPTLVGAVKAEEAKQVKSLEQLEVRLVRAQKQRFDTELNQLRAVKEKLFPGNGLQERYDNFIPYYLKHGKVFFEVLLENLDPLNTDFVVIQE